MIAPRLAARLKAGIASNVINLPSSTSPLKIKRKAFSSKAFETTSINTEKGIIILAPNAFELIEFQAKNCEIEKTKINIDTSVTINGGVTIGSGCFIGSGAITKDSIVIKKNSFIFTAFFSS